MPNLPADAQASRAGRQVPLCAMPTNIQVHGMIIYREVGIEQLFCLMEFARQDCRSMKVSISSKELEILRKAVYGLSADQIANELMISSREVEKSLKGVLKTTQSKEPLQAMQILAKNGFQITE